MIFWGQVDRQWRLATRLRDPVVARYGQSIIGCAMSFMSLSHAYLESPGC